MALNPESAFEWACRAVEKALIARTGGAVVSAYTEVALACLALGSYREGLQAAAAALSCDSGDDLSPTSALRIALAIAALAEGVDDEDVLHSATALIGTVRAVNVSLTVWPADEPLVGDLYRRLCAEIRLQDECATDVDALRQARSFGKWLRQNRMASASDE